MHFPLPPTQVYQSQLNHASIKTRNGGRCIAMRPLSSKTPIDPLQFRSHLPVCHTTERLGLSSKTDLASPCVLDVTGLVETKGTTRTYCTH